MVSKLKILQAYFQAKRRMQWSRKKIDLWHQKKIKQKIAYAKKHSPFYETLYGVETDFANLPIISKEEMMRSFAYFNVAGITKEDAIDVAKEGEADKTFDSTIGRLTVGLSSGTSGTRGIFLATPDEMAFWCGNILAKTLPKSIFKRQKVALFLRANSNLYETVSSFRYFDLEGRGEGLEAFAPDVLVAPPSKLLTLPPLRLKKVIAVAEVLEQCDRKAIEKRFGFRVHQIYQCTEGFLGSTCSHGMLHLNEDIVHFEKEYIDQKSGRFVPILTDLFRKTQPMIRYRLDDVLIEGRCSCGSNFMAVKAVEGRLRDTLYFKDKDGKKVAVFASEIGGLFQHDYVVRQTSIDELHVHGDRGNLPDFFAMKGLPLPTIHFHKKLPLRSPEVKLRRVIQEYFIG